MSSMNEIERPVYVNGKQITLTIGSPITGELTRIITEMQRTKKSEYQNKLDLYNYYMKGDIGTNPMDNSIAYTNPPGLYDKTDSAPIAIASKAVALFGSAILPLGVESVSVAAPQMLKQAIGEQSQAQVTQLVDSLTDSLRDILGNVSNGFSEAIASSVSDIVAYGCCFSVLEDGRINTIPFDNVFFLVPRNDQWQFYYWTTTHSVAWVWDHYGYRPKSTECSIYDVGSLVVPIQEVENGAYRYLKLKMLTEENKSGGGKILLGYEIVKQLDDIFECRMGSGNTIYSSRGAGINAIGNIVAANYYQNLCRISGNMAIAPCIFTPQTITFDSTHPATINGMDTDRQVIVFTPGGIIPFNQVADGSTAQMQIASQPAQQVEIFSKLYADQLVQVESAFGTDLYSTFGTAVTATEIMEKRQSAVRVFNGLSSQYYSQYMIPIVEHVLAQLLPSMGLGGATAAANFEVSIYNFSDIQQSEIKAERIGRMLNNLGSAAQIGQVIGPEAAQGLMKKVIDIEKLL